MFKTLIQNRAIREEEKILKTNLRTINLKYKAALNKTSAINIVESLNDVYSELYSFEKNNCTSIGYTNKIKSAVFAFYHKIDLKKIEFLPEINRVGNHSPYMG